MSQLYWSNNENHLHRINQYCLYLTRSDSDPSKQISTTVSYSSSSPLSQSKDQKFNLKILIIQVMSLVTKIWSMTQIMKRKIVMIQTIPCHHYQIGEYESDSMDDEEHRTISREKTIWHSFSAELRALTQSICSGKN